MTILATATLWSEIATAQADTSEVRRQLERRTIPYVSLESTMEMEPEKALKVFYVGAQAATESQTAFMPIVGEWTSFIRPADQSPMQTLSADLAGLTQHVDLDGADAPTALAIETAKMIMERSFALGVPPGRVLASAEGGVFIAYVQRDHMANIEIFNEGRIFAATHRDGINVWPISAQDTSEIDAAIERIREQLAN